jgi:hypothetical protein
MERYLIESPHELKDCALMLQQLKAMGYLHYFDWGCKAGVHTGWAVIEAEGEDLARLVVPPLVRSQARVVRLNKFSPEEVDALHEA